MGAARLAGVSALAGAVLLVGNAGAAATRIKEAPQACDSLFALGHNAVCLSTVPANGGAAYALRTSSDGAHWREGRLSLTGLSGQLQPRYFDRVAGRWYLIDAAHGLYDSTDGRQFQPLLPTATSGYASLPAAAEGEISGQPSVLLASTPALPTAVMSSGAIAPVAGIPGGPELFTTIGSNTWALGHPLQSAGAQSALVLARCNGIGVCGVQPNENFGAARLVAAAPMSNPRAVVLQRASGKFSVLVARGHGLHVSRALSRLLNRLQPGAHIASMQVGWAQETSNSALFRLVFDPDVNSSEPSLPGDLILAGDLSADQWHVISYAPSEFTRQFLRPHGSQAPWTASTCQQASGAALVILRHSLLAEHCSATSGMLFRSSDNGKNWAPVTH